MVKAMASALAAIAEKVGEVEVEVEVKVEVEVEVEVKVEVEVDVKVRRTACWWRRVAGPPQRDRWPGQSAGGFKIETGSLL